MGKPPGLISDIGPSPNIDHEKDMEENGASPNAARTMYIVIVIALVALFALVGIGLHIPTGG